MRRHNDRVRTIGVQDTKPSAATRIDDRRQGPEGFEWLPPVTDATVTDDAIAIELAGRGSADDAITTTDFVEVPR